jgi:hypothetical protein
VGKFIIGYKKRKQQKQKQKLRLYQEIKLHAIWFKGIGKKGDGVRLKGGESEFLH